MPRKTTITYGIGSSPDQKLCGTCGRRYNFYCILFNDVPLKADKAGKPMRCKACIKGEVK